MAGDYSTIRRELEPEFEEGQRIVLSYSHPRGALVRDHYTGKEILYPKAAPEPLFWITIKDVKRHKDGSWRVRFHVTDRRQKIRMVRRTPPAHGQGNPETAREESAYTSTPTQAVDHLEAVDDESLDRLTKRSRETWEAYMETERTDELAERERRRKAARLIEKMRRLQREALSAGVDITPQLVECIRSAEEAIIEEKAA